MTRLLLLLVALLAAPAVPAEEAAPASPGERVVWQFVPIAVGLKVGEERRVRFSVPVQAEMPNRLKAVLRTQWVDNHFYWLASAPFEPTRIRLRTADGRYLLIDLSAAPDGHTHPLEIVIPDPATSAPAEASPPASMPDEGRHGNVELTRFAARELYAPERLRRPLDGLTPLTVPTEALPLYRGAVVSTRALAAWQSGDRVISAIEVCNHTAETVVLDPRRIRARAGCGYGTCLIAATFQHNTLAPRSGDRPCAGYDVTALYLITSRPLAEAVPQPLGTVR